MSESSYLKVLTNLTLDENLQELIVSKREILTEIIAYVGEVDCRKMFLSFGYPSLFEYLTRRMGYSNASDEITETDFKSDQLRIDGVLFNLMTIGEAVKNLPDDLKANTPEIQWRNIGRFRDRVVHHYFSTNLDIVWEIVRDYLPALQKQVETLLSDMPDNQSSE